jgi:hypothetical protein
MSTRGEPRQATVVTGPAYPEATRTVGDWRRPSIVFAYEVNLDRAARTWANGRTFKGRDRCGPDGAYAGQ